jgi:hypothetical protein
MRRTLIRLGGMVRSTSKDRSQARPSLGRSPPALLLVIGRHWRSPGRVAKGNDEDRGVALMRGCSLRGIIGW